MVIHPFWIVSCIRAGLAERLEAERHFINLNILASQGLDEDFMDKKGKKRVISQNRTWNGRNR